MTLTWTITSLDIIKTDIDNRQIVRNIGWKLTGTDSGASYSCLLYTSDAADE